MSTTINNIDSLNFKTFNDAIHGHIKLDNLLVKVMDTVQFQRLRNIKQLGACYWIYPSACHNRFEHSLGTCHLAILLLKKLRLNSKNLKIEITEKDEFCVSLAALCHDLGHGPFSHLFDGRFLKEFPRARKHEDISTDMLDYLLDVNKLMPEIKGRFPDFNEFDMEFIREMIRGPANGRRDYIGRTDRKKKFLYDIVSNKETGVDVDKFDYISRDAKLLNIGRLFDHNRYIEDARIVIFNDNDGKESYKIAIRDKQNEMVNFLYETRKFLYKNAYYHHTTRCIEIMLNEAFILANKHLKLTSFDSTKTCSLAESAWHMDIYETLDDNIINIIMLTQTDNEKPELRKSQEILRRIKERRLYKLIGEIRSRSEKELIISLENFTSIIDYENYDNYVFWKEIIVLDKLKLDFGTGSGNPVDKCIYYKKDESNIGIHMQRNNCSSLLPKQYSENIYRFYLKLNNNDLLKKLRSTFESFKNEIFNIKN